MIALRQLEACVGGEFFTQLRPATLDLKIEAVEVNGEELRIEYIHQAINRGIEAFCIQLLRQITHNGTLAIVWDAQTIAEHGQQRLLGSHEIGLEHLFADGIRRTDFQRLVHPCVLIRHGFLLYEDRAQLAVGSQRGDCGLIDIPVIGSKPIENLSNEGGIDLGKNFVGVHGVEVRIAVAQSTHSRAAWQGRRIASFHSRKR